MTFIMIFVGAAAVVCLISALSCYRSVFIVEDRLRHMRDLLSQLNEDMDEDL